MLLRLKYIAINVLSSFFESRRNFFVLLLLLVAPLGMLYTIITQNHPASFTVMITNMSETSGGSGSIISTSNNKSIILTNAHVCDVLNKESGIVKKEDGAKFMVTGYRKSKFHDLCAVWVAADLKDKVTLATNAPAAYTEATITGHPALLPNVVNKGEFGERKFIEVLTGVKKCTSKNIKSETDSLYCMFFGVIPVVTMYESITVSAVIMGGSSGSAVLNTYGDLSGVVFAGQGRGLSYAFIVPYEYVSIFINEELKKEEDLTRVPLVEEEIEDEDEASVDEVRKGKKRIISICKKNSEKFENICSVFKQGVDLVD